MIAFSSGRDNFGSFEAWRRFGGLSRDNPRELVRSVLPADTCAQQTGGRPSRVLFGLGYCEEMGEIPRWSREKDSFVVSAYSTTSRSPSPISSHKYPNIQPTNPSLTTSRVALWRTRRRGVARTRPPFRIYRLFGSSRFETPARSLESRPLA